MTSPRLHLASSLVLELKLTCPLPLFLVVYADLEWKLIYVGSGESEKFDQELDSCMVSDSLSFERERKLNTRDPRPSRRVSRRA